MDVPDVIQQTRAKAFGSPNACQLLTILGVPEGRCHEIKVGDRFPPGHFQIEVLPAEHLKVPGFSPGPLPRRLRPPLRIRDYRMDTCFSFLIEVGGLSFLDWGSVCSEPAFPADVLWVNPGADAAYYLRFYNEQRVHQFLDYRTLVEVYFANCRKENHYARP